MLNNESKEMYLETILVLHKKNNLIRAIDIANEMKFSKPSVSKALHSLENDQYIIIEKNGNIKFTDEGLKIAEEVYERHNILYKALIKIGVSKEIADSDACRIEHHISDETFLKIKEFVDD